LELSVPTNKLITVAHDGTRRNNTLRTFLKAKSIPATPVGDNDLRVGRAIAERTPRCRYGDSERARGNNSSFPNPFEEFLFANHTIAIGEKVSD